MENTKHSDLPGRTTVIAFIIAIVIFVVAGLVLIPKIISWLNAIKTSIGSVP